MVKGRLRFPCLNEVQLDALPIAAGGLIMASVCGRFIEGFDTPDLQEAKIPLVERHK
jgi:hypothetical protein